MTASTIRLWDLGPSPNNKKVRLALGYKGIPYEKISVSGADRADVVRISGQPRTPVLQHGETVIFDSGAIIRYLEANVKREPRLFSSDYEMMGKIERWEDFARNSLAPPVGALFGQFFAESKDASVIQASVAKFNEECRKLEAALSDKGVLLGDHLSAADIICAAWVGLSLVTPVEGASHPILGFFAENLRLDPSFSKLRSWYSNINRYDS